MEGPLDGQVAIVTGAGRGIGRGCAEALADAGARVIAIARSTDDLARVAAHPTGRIETWSADVTDDSLFDRIATVKGLSILVNNAGGNRPQPFVDVDADSLDFVIDLNVRAAFRIAQAATRAMLASGTEGSIVNMSSQMGHVGSPNRSVYCMSKHAIEGLTKAMAGELAASGIRVNAVAPTFIETPMTRPMMLVQMMCRQRLSAAVTPSSVSCQLGFRGSASSEMITSARSLASARPGTVDRRPRGSSPFTGGAPSAAPPRRRGSRGS